MARLTLNPVASPANDGLFDRFVMAATGPIRRDLTRRAVNVQRYQIRRAPRKTGKLVSTSRKNDGRRGLSPYVDVIIGRQGETDYLGYLLFGTNPHQISAIPNRANAHLRFVSHGRIVFAKDVWHPGNRPIPFVQDSLYEALK